MNNLIQITQTQINGSEINSVNARELHTALGLKNKFANWIKKQQETLDTYEEGVDYIRTTKDAGDFEVIVKSGLSLKGKECEYILTLDMAKHICMMSKTKKGKEVRQYFIDAEKQSKSLMSPDQVMQSLQLTAQTFKIHDEILDTHHQRIKEVETYIQDDLKSRPVNYIQQRALMDAKNKKVYELALEDVKLQTALHRKVWQLFKKSFQLPRYSELPAVKYDEGIWFINNLSIADMV